MFERVTKTAQAPGNKYLYLSITGGNITLPYIFCMQSFCRFNLVESHFEIIYDQRDIISTVSLLFVILPLPAARNLVIFTNIRMYIRE